MELTSRGPVGMNKVRARKQLRGNFERENEDFHASKGVEVFKRSSA